MDKESLLRDFVEHIDIRSFDARPIIQAYGRMAFQARNLNNASAIFNRMLKDDSCSIILTLAGSLFSAGLKNVVTDMIRCNMVDVIVSTGAIIIDQDFFEGIGYRHYLGDCRADDDQLRRLRIDRIYDTYINEDELRDCDLTVTKISNGLNKRSYSSREFIKEMGIYLEKHHPKANSVILEAYRHDVPIFVPAFSDSSAGFGLILHQRQNTGEHVAIDSVKDFRELTEIKIASQDTGLFMVGGGVPKNFAQDIVVATDVLGDERPMHKYAVQITVADERDGGLSGSTLKEASSWGKVDKGFEQMVWGEATLVLPLMISDAYHRGNWKERSMKKYQGLFP
ncbi:MAG: deoxyhypusine synthase [Deltaproteobacteria bacterium]|nr:deoxyhypusine synthase [Deltaproteobacteria bacterium]